MRNTTEPKNIPPAVAQGCLPLGPPQAVTQFLGESEFQRQWLTRHCSPPGWVHWDHPTYPGVAGLIGACFPQQARGLPGCPTSRLQTELADSLTQGIPGRGFLPLSNPLGKAHKGVKARLGVTLQARDPGVGDSLGEGDSCGKVQRWKSLLTCAGTWRERQMGRGGGLLLLKSWGAWLWLHVWWPVGQARVGTIPTPPLWCKHLPGRAYQGESGLTLLPLWSP